MPKRFPKRQDRWQLPTVGRPKPDDAVLLQRAQAEIRKLKRQMAGIKGQTGLRVKDERAFAMRCLKEKEKAEQDSRETLWVLEAALNALAGEWTENVTHYLITGLKARMHQIHPVKQQTVNQDEPAK